MFFALSGFVIALAYEEKLKAGFGFSFFMRARAKRLLAIQTIGTLLSAVTLFALEWHSGPRFWPFAFVAAAGLLLLPISWTPFASLFPAWRSPFPINVPLWSLQGEWAINSVYGLFLYAWSLPALLALAGAAIAYVFGLSFTYLGWASVPVGLGRATLGFVLGVIIYRLHRRPAFQRLPRISPWLVYALWFLISSIPQSGRYPIMQVIPIALISAVFVALWIRNEQPMGAVFKHLGRLSYPLYASHFAVVNLALLFLAGPEKHGPLWIMPMVAASLLLAVALDKIVNIRGLPQGYGARLFWRPANQTSSPD